MHKYLITSKELYSDTPAVFSSVLRERFVKHMPSYALYRDKSNPNYKNLAKEFVEVCSQFQDLKSFIHQNIDLAEELNAFGVHLTSKQFDKIEDAKSRGLEVIVSTHTHEEVLHAQELGADAVTYSPIFESPGKGEPKGIDDFNELLEKYDINVFALGGIVDETHVGVIGETKAYGFASIRYFI